MATDYDASNTTDEGTAAEPIEELRSTAAAVQSPVVDEDETEAADSFELPGADLSHEELTIQILPAQADEFTCSSCFLVRHRSQIAREKNGLLFCSECEG